MEENPDRDREEVPINPSRERIRGGRRKRVGNSEPNRGEGGPGHEGTSVRPAAVSEPANNYADGGCERLQGIASPVRLTPASRIVPRGRPPSGPRARIGRMRTTTEPQESHTRTTARIVAFVVASRAIGERRNPHR